jgi:CRISPR-associated protein Cas1
MNYGRIISLAEGNYLLREKQYAIGETEELDKAKKSVANKIFNQIILLENSDGKGAAIFLEGIKSKIGAAQNPKDLLGLEGSASKFFFQSYFKELGWKRRAPRSKIDIPNYLMDIGYTMMFNFCDAMLGIYGFDAYKGFYHKLFFQRKSLACDIMEPFRSVIDKQILKSYHLGQIKEKDFKISKGVYGLGFEEQKIYLEIFAAAIMERKEEIFCYVRDYYYHTMNGSDFPEFKIK